MATSEQLSKLHKQMQLNKKSKYEDRLISSVAKIVAEDLQNEYGVKIEIESRLYIRDIVKDLRKRFPEVKFENPENNNSFITPDAGISYLIDKESNKYVVLIGETKCQGTNDERQKQGLSKQAMGNAIERLGKNVIAFRTYLMNESIFPFVCFGDGCDFAKGSSILDRVHAISMFRSLNEDHTFNEGKDKEISIGSYYFRAESWTESEIFDIMYDVAKKSVNYYFEKYGREIF